MQPAGKFMLDLNAGAPWAPANEQSSSSSKRAEGQNEQSSSSSKKAPATHGPVLGNLNQLQPASFSSKKTPAPQEPGPGQTNLNQHQPASPPSKMTPAPDSGNVNIRPKLRNLAEAVEFHHQDGGSRFQGFPLRWQQYVALRNSDPADYVWDKETPKFKAGRASAATLEWRKACREQHQKITKFLADLDREKKRAEKTRRRGEERKRKRAARGRKRGSGRKPILEEGTYGGLFSKKMRKRALNVPVVIAGPRENLAGAGGVVKKRSAKHEELEPAYEEKFVSMMRRYLLKKGEAGLFIVRAGPHFRRKGVLLKPDWCCRRLRENINQRPGGRFRSYGDEEIVAVGELTCNLKPTRTTLVRHAKFHCARVRRYVAALGCPGVLYLWGTDAGSHREKSSLKWYRPAAAA